MAKIDFKKKISRELTFGVLLGAIFLTGVLYILNKVETKAIALSYEKLTESNKTVK